MKKLEKTIKTRERILAVALKEFGTKTYDVASINNICESGQIPKGLLYHNFKGKDDLYLRCVKICFDEMTAALEAQDFLVEDAKESIQRLIISRQRFFEENPCYANIFFNAVLQPPPHLLQELAVLRNDFNTYIRSCYERILKTIPLRDSITIDMALDYFIVFSETFNEYYRKKAGHINDYHTLIGEREDNLSWMFDVMFYGIAQRTPGSFQVDKEALPETPVEIP